MIVFISWSHFVRLEEEGGGGGGSERLTE